jgi:hypothetical protein
VQQLDVVPLDTSAAAMRQSPRANDGPGVAGRSPPSRPTIRSRAEIVTMSRTCSLTVPSVAQPRAKRTLDAVRMRVIPEARY